MISVNIKRKEITYPIYVNYDGLETLKNAVLNEIGNINYVVIMSKKVYKLYSNILDFPKDKIYIFPDGEKHKNSKNYLKILDFALKNKLKRDDAIIAIGGGVVGDIAGFAASTYMRGIKYIQIPTTLLAATDSSVGGKTAIDTKYGKNLIGSFYQPNAVFININFLKTLDDKQYKSGLGEVIKYGFIEKSCNSNEDVNLLNFLVNNIEKILQKDTLILSELIQMCIRLKVKVVEADEKESGLRRVLNFGHTYAHAIETITDYNKYTHGEAVVEGIKFVINLASKLSLIDKEYKFLCEDLINKFGYKPLKSFPKEKILKYMQTDKKATKNSIKLILPNDYANVCERDFTPEELSELF